jgi:hypothetical protein
MPRVSGRWLWLQFLLVSAAWCASAAGAVAQLPDPTRVLVLGANDGEDPAFFAEVLRGLRSAGLHAVQLAELQVDPVLAACRAPECAKRAGEVTHLPVLLCTRASHRASVELQWFAQDGTQIVLQGARGSASWSDVIATLAQRLRRKLVLGDRALLRVQSVPASASVWLDGQLVGITPFEQPWPAGLHELRVEMSGRRTEVRRILLDGAELLNVTVPLSRELEASGARAGELASPANFVLGGALALVAVPLLFGAVDRLANQGQCLESAAGSCTQRGDFGPVGAGFLAGGVIALAGASYLLIGQPFRVGVAVDRAGVSVHAHGSF